MGETWTWDDSWSVQTTVECGPERRKGESRSGLIVLLILGSEPSELPTKLT